MESTWHTFQRKRGQRIGLAFPSDAHLGNPGSDINSIQEAVKLIHDTSDMYWINPGDAIDGILPSDKRFDTKTIEQLTNPKVHPYLKETGTMNHIIARQCQAWVTLFRPIRHKCLGILEGNHEEEVRKRMHGGFDPMEHIMVEMNRDRRTVKPLMDKPIPYLGYSARVGINFRDGKRSHTFNIYLHHGFMGEWSKLSGDIIADLYVMGHQHKVKIEPYTRLFPSHNGRYYRDTPKTYWPIKTGSFLKNYQLGHSEYQERRGYKPSVIGMAYVWLTMNNNGRTDIADGIHCEPRFWIAGQGRGLL